MKKVIIIHGWGSGPNEHWYQDEKKLLEGEGYEVCVPLMPDTDLPILEKWLEALEGLKPDEDTVLIGHSLGVPTILRYLENGKNKVCKAILIAGFAESLGLNETNNFVEKPFDWEMIKKGAKEFVAINQIDDPWVPLEVGKRLASNLDVEIVEVQGDNHFDTMDLDLINSNL